MEQEQQHTRVVNVSVKHIRPQYQTLREWMADAQNVYIGRGSVIFVDGARFPPQQSPWANPFRVVKGERGVTRAQAIARYRLHMLKLLELDPDLNAQLLALRGKTLGCWCRPEACHGDVLVELIERAYATAHRLQ